MKTYVYDDSADLKYQRHKPIQYVITKAGCHECISHAKNGGGYVKVRVKGQAMYLHRYVYERAYGKIPDGMVVMHTCDNPACCNVKHMQLGTLDDNNKDRAAKNRTSRKHQCKRPQNGEMNKSSKLTAEQVKAIRKDTRTLKEIGKDYGVSYTTIHYIKLRKKWAWLKS